MEVERGHSENKMRQVGLSEASAVKHGHKKWTDHIGLTFGGDEFPR